MRNGFWAGVVLGALIALLPMQQPGYAAKGSVKPKHHTTVITGKHIPEKTFPRKASQRANCLVPGDGVAGG